MNRAAFIDTNVPIYAAGREHPYKEPCVRVLTMVAQHPLAFVTSVEVLQEIVHYYHASRRWELGREVLRSFSEIMHERIEPVYEWDIYFAASLAELQPHISTRDLLHAAVMNRLESDQIISADTDFDLLPEIARLDPYDVVEWGDSLVLGENQ